MVAKYRAVRRRKVYLRQWINHLELNQKVIADRMETSEENVSRWLAHPERISLDILSGFADGLRVPISDLFIPPERAKARDNTLNALRGIDGLNFPAEYLDE